MKNSYSKYTDKEFIEIFEHVKQSYNFKRLIELIDELLARLKNKNNVDENLQKICTCGQKLTKFRGKQVCSAALTGCNEDQTWIEE